MLTLRRDGPPPHSSTSFQALPMPLAGWFRSLAHLVLEWQARARERHALANLDAHMRRDVGLTESDIQREIDKPFWRP